SLSLHKYRASLTIIRIQRAYTRRKVITAAALSSAARTGGKRGFEKRKGEEEEEEGWGGDDGVNACQPDRASRVQQGQLGVSNRL
ncbi:hypothetical protein INR49_027085, partial [Caranx melampygus]